MSVAPRLDYTSQPQIPCVIQPKRRRSTAEPSLGGPSRRRTAQPIQPTLIEESEPEEETVVRKVGRPKKTVRAFNLPLLRSMMTRRA